jgi:3'-phosphoadenosine 5'-phosphosulfate sulfotransferase (PAPS reductase)/FAD synthetase
MTNAELRSYDLIVVNSSGGKDSQAMLHVVATQAREAGVLDRVVVAHAALEEEWRGTVEVVQDQAAAYGLAVQVVRRPQGTLLEQVRSRGMWPSSTARYCTSDHKRDQVAKIITSRCRTGRVLNCMGIRSQESAARSKKVPFARNGRLSNRSRTVMDWFPIFDLSVEAVWAIIRAAGTKAHPAYALGMPRLSCVFCVFAPKAALMLAGQHNPELLERYVAVEQEIGHTFRKDLRIADIRAALAAGEVAGAIRTWEM